MDFALQRQKQQEAARMMLYQNSGYQFERRDRKTVLIDVRDGYQESTQAEDSNDINDYPLANATEFTLDLFEPLIIDKLSDVYLDSFLTYNSLTCHTTDKMAFCLLLNEFNINSNNASTSSKQELYNRIIIPNEHINVNDSFSCKIHKGKKLNYVCSVNPGKITKFTGKITDLNGKSMFTTSNTTNNISSKLYVIEITPASEYVPQGAVFSNGGTNHYVVAHPLTKSSTTLFYYPKDHNDGSALSGTITDISNAAGIGGQGFTSGTHRAQDNARFIAELVIVARD